MLRDLKTGLKFLEFNSFPKKGLTHAIFARHGGISPFPFKSLNVGGTTGDLKVNVIENRRRIFESLSLPVDSIFDVWQVHGKDVIYTKKSRPLSSSHEKADIILTDQPGVTLLMRFADCVPILLFDPVHRAIGIAHAGWQGTCLKVVEAAVTSMMQLFKSNPKELIAGIGPSIGPDHYEIGNKVIDEVNTKLNFIKDEVLVKRSEKIYFDLWKSNELMLRELGVQQIEVANICTYCNNSDWYSHRREGQSSGRFAALIGLSEI